MPATYLSTSLTLTTGRDATAVLSSNVTIRVLLPNAIGTLAPVTDTESSTMFFLNESESPAENAEKWFDEIIVMTAKKRQIRVRFIKKSIVL